MIRFIAKGAPGGYPGSAYVRTVARAEAASALLGEEVAYTTAEDWLHGPEGTDVLLVERDAVPAELVDAVVSTCRERGVRLVIDLDDDLLSPSSRGRLLDGGYEEAELDGLQRIVAAADAVIVSTAELADRLGDAARDVHVVPNRLSPVVWTDEVETVPTRRPNAAVRVLYMGSATHVDDIAIVRSVFDGRSTRYGSTIELDVVGVLDDDEDWFTRLDVPRGERSYDRFSTWLRRHHRRWDIGIAPLAKTPFNDAKSDLKFLEYTALGLPTVASADSPYAGTDANGAVLVDNDPDVWFSAIEELADSPRRRREAVAASTAYLLDERMLASEDALADWWSVLRPA
ncbi:hypothetical protein ELQ92_01400 [Labedella populi]|uniref:Glycosyltransferase family 1 protein n=1 Tax=Labedella populi TaxID=2498850 RepID=A0A3S4A205_9MICO|nr:hypothetical protein [Labedella populi]RWZ67947.1 hypothetical protein ELQ92_01400 [Labedella populi]